MSERWPGGIINGTAPVPSGPYQNSTAPGVWTMEQAAYWQAQGNWPTPGSVDPSAFIENLFQTWLYTGNDATQTINNGIDLAGKGGLVWIKARNDTQSNLLFDTNRGTNSFLQSNSTSGANTGNDFINSFNLNGFTVGINANFIPNIFASWTFRKAAKFFDVVTYTGNGATPRNISHNLGSTPGMIIIKRTSTSGSSWWTWHRSISTGDLSGNNLLNLNNTNAQTNIGTVIGTANSTTFQIGDDSSVNLNGGTYVAYLFAHNAGGFGTTGTDNVISCGSFTGDSTVTLGYEPQYLMFKRTDSTGNWRVLDNMRGMPVIASSTGSQQVLFPNTSGAESTDGVASPTATGFQTFLGGGTYIYMAIRRGPMKVPTTGTSVFVPNAAGTNASAGAEVFSSTFTPDFHFRKDRTSVNSWFSNARLTPNNTLSFNTTNAQQTLQFVNLYDRMTGIGTTNAFDYTNWAGWLFKRAPGFFDVVCYTGIDAALNVNHNLGVVPEMMIVKCRSNAATEWQVYHSSLGNTKALRLNSTAIPSTGSGFWDNTTPTSSVFTVGNATDTGFTYTYVAYLFASCPGVSKVGSYTGTGSTQTISCGFTGGARFVLIKRTDSTGNWWVWDTARGMVTSTDPRLALNSTAAELNNDWVLTTTGGFQIVTSDATINASGGSYIFLAIA